MIKLSYILPCYNVSKYISRCIDSILAQDLQVGEYEIICVNDCSTDNIIDIISDYQKLYPNIKLINHSKNLTAGGARNTGIDAAQGKYIWFVDPDDAICPDSVSQLLEMAECNNLDILVFNEKIKDLNGEITYYNRVSDSKIYNGQDFLIQCVSNISQICSVCNQLFNATFLKKSQVRYPLIPASQDVVFLWEIFINAYRVRSISSVCYFVYRRENSTTGPKGFYSSRTCISLVLFYPIELLKLIQRNKIRLTLIDEINIAIRRSVNDNIKRLYSMPYKEKKIFYRHIVNHKEDINRIYYLMNTSTKRLLKEYSSYIHWNFVVILQKIWNIYKR